MKVDKTLGLIKAAVLLQLVEMAYSTLEHDVLTADYGIDGCQRLRHTEYLWC